MPDFLISVLAFIVAISVLVAVHEYGHFWVARKLGFKVLRFSIGFGRPLLQWRGRDADRIEYWVSAIPLGGYVKMLDEREGPVEEHERERAFNRRPIPHRIAVLLAGPGFNFLFAVVAYWVISRSSPALRPSSARFRKREVAQMSTANNRMENTTTVSRKAVPQRGCSSGKRATDSGVSSAPASNAWIVLCSAPW